MTGYIKIDGDRWYSDDGRHGHFTQDGSVVMNTIERELFMSKLSMRELNVYLSDAYAELDDKQIMALAMLAWRRHQLAKVQRRKWQKG